MFFCKQIEKLVHYQSGGKLENQLSFIVFDSAKEVEQTHWNEVLQDRNLYLDLKYLQTLDNIPRKNFQSRYIIIYKHALPFAIAYFQVIDFEAGVFGDLLDSKINTIKSSRAKLFENYIGAYSVELSLLKPLGAMSVKTCIQTNP